MTTQQYVNEILAFAKTLDWQPIETAPRDGAEILVRTSDVNHATPVITRIARWQKSGDTNGGVWCASESAHRPIGFYDSRYNEWVGEPKFWMPIPDKRFAEVIRKLVEALSYFSHPHESGCDAARDFILSTDMGCNTYENVIENLKKIGARVPNFLLERSGNLTKWDRAECITRIVMEGNQVRALEIVAELTKENRND